MARRRSNLTVNPVADLDRATESDDPVLGQTAWPLPGHNQTALAHRIAWDCDVTKVDRAHITAIMSAYRALICDVTTTRQVARLRALRRIYARKLQR